MIELTKELSEKVKKNLLDIQYNKYVQYFNTSVIIAFSYIIGVGITFITKQIDYKNSIQLTTLIIISVIFLGINTSLLLKFKLHQSNILEEIKKLGFMD